MMILHAVMGLLVAAVLLSWILSIHVNDGLVIKIGLIGIFMGEVAASLLRFSAANAGIEPDAIGIGNAGLAINLGMAVALAGLLYRRHRSGKSIRRFTDLAPFDERPSSRDFNDSQYGFPHTDIRP